MWLVFIQATLILVQSQNMGCGGDRSVEEEIPHNRRHLLTRSSTLAPIRVYFHYYNFDLGTPELNSYFSNSLMPAVESFVTKSLKVYSYSEKVKLSVNNCLSSVVVPSEHKTIGVDTDLIIYLGVDNLATADYIAYAGTCQRDTLGLSNAIAGTVILNIPNFAGSAFVNSIAAVTHEISHVLGFSSSSFNNWRTPSGTLYAASELKLTKTIRGATKILLVTPNIVAKAREAFGCSTLEGIELEEFGGSGTAGSHWDKRVMMNDFMTGYLPAEPIWSTVTLAALQDSGWYTVDYTLAVPPIFGKLQGCGFFNNKCLINEVTTDNRVWCDTQSTYTCDIFALNKGTCKVTTETFTLPPEFQYYSNPYVGGVDDYTDYCPYRSRYSNGSCRGNNKSTAVKSGANDVIGVKSRCFESTLKQGSTAIVGPYSACYEVTCVSGVATVKIGTQTIVCPSTGGNFNVPGYAGLITCPASNILCEDVPCLNMCYGRGSCSKGYCSCFAGYSGNDCSTTCSTGCKTCDSTGCTECISQYSKINGACVKCPSNCNECSSTTSCTSCSGGYFINNGGCSQCEQPCATCTGLSVCQSCISGYGLVNDACVIICPNNCNSCTLTQCTSCNIGYYPDTANSCAACFSTCKTCDSSTVCTSCLTGYYLDTNTCLPCPGSCTTCTSLTSCNSCGPGFILTNSVCNYECPLNCEFCKDKQTCIECSLGYYLESGVCNLCRSPCSTCTSSKDCTDCVEGYRFENNKCKSNCKEFEKGICSECLSGYYLSGGVCLECITPCTECSSKTKCLECDLGYTLENGFCVQCPTGCSECNDLNACSKCSSGYRAYDDKCLPCSANCLECTASKCKKCKQGFTKSGGICV